MADVHDIDRLIAAAFNGNLSDDESAQLEQFLEQDADVREAYLVAADLDADLRFVISRRRATQAKSNSAQPWTDTPSTTHVAPRKPSFMQWASRHPKGPAIAVAIVVMVALLLALSATPLSNFLAKDGSEHKRNSAGLGREVASLSDWHRVKWVSGKGMSGRNHRLKVGQVVALTSGLIEITFDTKATVVIEGPAEFVVGRRKDEGGRMKEEEGRSEGHPSSFIPHPSNSGFLRLGTLVARCNSSASKSFTVVTPSGSIEDLGTEFGVEVLRQGVTNVEVFDGSVELAVGTQRRTLVESESARIDREGIHSLADSRLAKKTWTRSITGQSSRHEQPAPGGKLVWEGAAGNGDLFDEHNWNLNGRGHPPAGSIESGYVIGHDATIDSVTITVKQTRKILLGNGRTWTFTDSTVEGDTNTSYHPRDLEDGGSAAIHLRGSTKFEYGWSWDIRWTLHDRAHLVASNSNENPISGVLGKSTTLNFVSSRATFELTDVAPSDVQSLREKFFVNGKPCVLGSDPEIAEPGDNLMIRSNGDEGTIVVPVKSAFGE